jgi:hypothetical protein
MNDQRITANQTYSEKLLAAYLEKHGVTLDDYNQLAANQNNLCARCGRAETQRFKSGTAEGKSKYLTLHPNDSAKLICSKCQSAIRTANIRAGKGKEAKEFESAEEFWNANRKQLSSEEIAAFERRTREILLLADAMLEYVNGTDGTNESDLRATVEEIRDEIKAHGEVAVEVAFIDFWRNDEKSFLQRVIASGGPTATFAKYGYLTALPSNRVYEFLKQFGAPTPAVNITTAYTTMRCACGSTTAVQKAVADMFAEAQKAYRCLNCIDAERKLRAPLVGIHREFAQPESNIFDQYGRLKDQ